MEHSRLGGHAVVEQLVALGADLGFSVPGESYLAVLDGLYDVSDRFRLITTRQEGGAAMMAAAAGQLTGRPGIAMVTRGPGATNASIGVHIANQDGSPMVLLVGQVPTTELGMRAFQEIDYRSMYADVAKAVLQVELADRIPEQVARAYDLAISGEPGPVVLSLPEDVLMTPTSAPIEAPVEPPVSGIASAQIERVTSLLAGAERPLVLVGGSRWTPAAVDGLRAFAEAGHYPVATTARCQDLIDNRSPAYVGTLGLRTTPGLAEAAAQADVVLLIGSRPDGLTITDAPWLRSGHAAHRLLHVHPDPDALQHVRRAEIGIAADPAAFVDALAGHAPAAAEDTRWLQRLQQVRKEAAGVPLPGGDPSAYMDALNARLDADAILSAGAGSYTGWHQRFHSYTRYPSQLASRAGAMGYGLPAAIAAKLLEPEREVVAFAGDGCFAMNGQELSTAVRYGLGLTVVVVNNATFGTILGHQQRIFPGRPSGTTLENPDFAALARAYGAHGVSVSSPDEFATALDERPGGDVPSLIEIAFPYE